MSRGAILFAFNSPKFNYYKMAEATAKRVNHFLSMPVTVVTDENSLLEKSNYNFDKTIIVEPDKDNKRNWGEWYNKGRYQAYELSPYNETLLLDTDYMVNSDKLLTIFNYYDDFCCHDNVNFLMEPGLPQEVLSTYSFKTLWATVVAFKKSSRTKQIFECLELVQKNFNYYSNLHGFVPGTYRNDYALTLALRIVNGHIINKRDIIPWNLLHTGQKNIQIYRNSENEYNTEYTLMFDTWKKGKLRKDYITIKNLDFHVMNKDNFLELIE